MQGIFQKENTDKALKYGIYRHLPTYEKIIRNLVSFYREKLNENRFVILIYYECRYAQFALSSVIELPRIPAYYPKTTLLELPIPVKALFRPVLMPPIIGLLTIRKAKKLTN